MDQPKSSTGNQKIEIRNRISRQKNAMPGIQNQKLGTALEGRRSALKLGGRLLKGDEPL